MKKILLLNIIVLSLFLYLCGCETKVVVDQNASTVSTINEISGLEKLVPRAIEPGNDLRLADETADINIRESENTGTEDRTGLRE